MNLSSDSAEIIIVGAGIVGLSIAWQLHRRGQKGIVILEKGAGVGEGSTGASSAVCRYRYSSVEMIRLARAGIDSYRNWSEFTQLEAPRAAFQNLGVLWFTGSDTQWADRESQRMRDLGIRTEVLDNHALVEAFPSINPCTTPVDLIQPEAHACAGSGRHMLELDGGYMDPVYAAQDLVEACRTVGIEIRFNSSVTDVLQAGGRIRGVRLQSGESISAPKLVNAAGPWCRYLYQAIGVDAPMPLAPVRIQVVHLDRSAQLEGHIPITADMQAGIYFRTQNQGQQLLVSSVREEDERERVEDPDNYLRVADDVFRMEKLHLLQHRLPGLQINRSLRDYCGLYTLNFADVHPVLGAYGPEGFYVANGFSGHGFKTAPAVGAMLAREITGIRLPDEDTQDDGWLSADREPFQLETLSVLA